jgi:hypothetical protein
MDGKTRYDFEENKSKKSIKSGGMAMKKKKEKRKTFFHFSLINKYNPFYINQHLPLFPLIKKIVEGGGGRG